MNTPTLEEDCRRFEQLVDLLIMSGPITEAETFYYWLELEVIKNRHGGFPPTQASSDNQTAPQSKV